jgi:predicted RNA-binding protein YlxR (DUF448 family)
VSQPERTCLACRRKRPKLELLRIVRSPRGDVGVDTAGHAEGRGTYVCRDDRGCRGSAPRALARALRMTLTPGDLARLATEMDTEMEKEKPGA